MHSGKNIEYVEERGFKPVFNVIDNVALKAIRAYLKEAKVGIQWSNFVTMEKILQREQLKYSKTIL